MGTIIKFLFRNIQEKKTRTSLIIFSIAISSALVFASQAINETALNIYVKQIQSAFGPTELVIQPNDKSPSQYFQIPIPTEVTPNLSYTVGIVETDAAYRHSLDETVLFRVKGIDWSDLQRLSPLTLQDDTDLSPFGGRKAIISSYTAKKYRLAIGETLELDIHKNRYKFIIAGVAEPTGLFTGEDRLILVPKAKLSAICSRMGHVSKLYIKLNNPAEKANIQSAFSKSIARYDVRETISEQEFQERTGALSTVLMITLIIVLMLSVFIIFTSFKVIATERLPVIGTFRSVGADRRITDGILLAESCIYGIIGGIIGCLMGLGVLYLIAMAMMENPGRGSAEIVLNFHFYQMVIAFFIAIVLTIISSAIPILQVSGLPVKDIVLNQTRTKSQSLTIWRLLLGLIFIGVILGVPPRVDGDIGIMLDLLCMGLAIASTILLTPFTTAGLIKLFEGLSKYGMGAASALAVKNLRDNRNVQNSIILIAMGISTILLVNILGHSMVIGITDFTEKTITYDLSLITSDLNRTVLPSARSVQGVRDALGLYYAYDINVVGAKDKINLLEGIDPSRFGKFKKIGSEKSVKPMLEALDYGRNVILTYLLKTRYGLKANDTVTLRLNNKDRTYRVIGFIDTMEADGSYAIISDRYFRADTGQAFYSELAVKTRSNPDVVLKRLLNKFNRSLPSGSTIREHREMIMDEIRGILAVLNGLSIITAAIGLFGLINNLIINFIERKRSIAILRSIGANKLQTIRIVVLEAAFSGIIGGIIGILSGLLVLSIMPYFTRAMIATIPMKLSLPMFLGVGMTGVFITLMASVVPALRSSRLNLIEAIKYE